MPTIDAYVECATRLLCDDAFADSVAAELGPANLRRSQIFDSSQTRKAFTEVLLRIQSRA